jgi:hypothetical protein
MSAPALSWKTCVGCCGNGWKGGRPLSTICDGGCGGSGKIMVVK